MDVYTTKFEDRERNQNVLFIYYLFKKDSTNTKVAFLIMVLIVIVKKVLYAELLYVR